MLFVKQNGGRRGKQGKVTSIHHLHGWSGMGFGGEWSCPFFFFFVNKTHPGVESDILAIKTIRFLFALPRESREFVFLRKDRERWGGWQGAIKDG